jgi:hypothetical protein
MKSSEDPYVDVELLERALALALSLPRFPEKSNAKREAAVRGVELERILTEDRERTRAPGAGTRRSTLGQMPNQGFPLPHTWLGKRTHFTSRLALIELLWEARASALGALRLLPQPDRYGKWERAVPTRFAADVPSWENLPARLQRVLKALRGRRKTAKELSSKLGGYNSARKLCAELVRLRVLRRPSRDGYVFDQVPRGMPNSLLPRL